MYDCVFLVIISAEEIGDLIDMGERHLLEVVPKYAIYGERNLLYLGSCIFKDLTFFGEQVVGVICVEIAEVPVGVEHIKIMV